ncbi:MAG: hypothetical protein HN348_24305, partial [Proteobacteria bacterium]|nr:hypothetical protein [Pseudomonadota bacterium]
MADKKSKSALKGCLGRLLRLVLFVSVLSTVALVAGLVAFAWLYDRHVVRNPGSHLERDNVRSIIAQESPVYFRDGTTRVGVFFEDEHRQFVTFDELPQPYVMGIVAAEDGAFWSHWGLNPKHIVRAMRDNFIAGRVVAGGSTLTQQTAKNLYYRPDRSLRSKWVELVNALRLEAHFDKEEILTFYVNQFHVSGNGRGLGIAARHFFDKEVEELEVVEAVFLAGLVKAPSHYDPFLGDQERRMRAVERADERTRYVLRRMIDEPIKNLVGPAPTEQEQVAYNARLMEAGRIRAEAQRLLDEGFELQFKRGVFRYDSSAVLDEVARRLGEAPFDEVLDEAGIDDPATAGLVVITTLDPDIQHAAIYGLWHHLTEVGSWMEGLNAKSYIREGRGPRFDPDRTPKNHQFRLAQVTNIASEPMKHLEVDLGGHGCTIDRDAIIRAGVAAIRGEKKNRTARAPTKYLDDFVDQFKVDDVIWVSVREVREDGAYCDLEVRPDLQGAVVVLEDGQIRGMVGGNDNRNFNRASALRQMGSTWKPLIYHAALQLGWSPADELDNARGVFPWSTTYYYPRPDHEPKPVVSMAWAGVNSENLASIWLLYHLTDRMSFELVAALAESMGLARQPDEEEDAYRHRIQIAGVLPLVRRVEEALFLKARKEVIDLDLVHEEDALSMASLLYGWGHNGESQRVARGDPRERATKKRALDNSWRRLSDLMVPCALQHQKLMEALEENRLSTGV